MIGIERFNITINGYNRTMVASGAAIVLKYSSNWWKIRRKLNSDWKEKFICVTFKQSDNATTGGSWECKQGMSHPTRWEMAHGNVNGYLTHKVLPENNCIQNDNYQTCIISCRKTNGKCFLCKVSYTFIIESMDNLHYRLTFDQDNKTKFQKEPLKVVKFKFG